jgi:hypothetical protein
MGGGYQGEGFKTVIPAMASAKISFRLVFDQDPHKVRAAFREFVRRACRPTAGSSSSSTARAGRWPSTPRPRFPEGAQGALTDEWGKEAAFIGGGGSIPVTTMLKEKIGMDVVMAGFGLRTTASTARTRSTTSKSFHKGIRSWARILAALRALPARADGARFPVSGNFRVLRLAVGGERRLLRLRPGKRAVRPRRAGAAARDPCPERCGADRACRSFHGHGGGHGDGPPAGHPRLGRRARPHPGGGAARPRPRPRAVPVRGERARPAGASDLRQRLGPRPGAPRLGPPARAGGAAGVADRHVARRRAFRASSCST